MKYSPALRKALRVLRKFHNLEYLLYRKEAVRGSILELPNRNEALELASAWATVLLERDGHQAEASVQREDRPLYAIDTVRFTTHEVAPGEAFVPVVTAMIGDRLVAGKLVFTDETREPCGVIQTDGQFMPF